MPNFFSELYARDHGHGHNFGHRGGPPMRMHTVVKISPLCLIPASVSLKFRPKARVSFEKNSINIRSNGIPNHKVGKFPNCGNPHTILEQDHKFRLERNPKFSSKINSLKNGWAFGVAVNGIPWEPLAAEYYQGNRNSDWRYDALSGAVSLGVDENQAHVQPDGKYHYHGLPWGLMKKLNISSKRHSPLIGWAADGFPIYALYGYSGTTQGIKEHKSSYRLKKGLRSSGFGHPGGKFDGSFISDYEFIEGLGDLDECNGLEAKTPEFPQGTYVYFISRKFPIVPRCFKGTPDRSFYLRLKPSEHRLMIERQPRQRRSTDCDKC